MTTTEAANETPAVHVARRRTPSASLGEEAEIQALVKIQRALAPLSTESRSRVLAWFAQESGRGTGSGRPASAVGSEDLSTWFEAAGPRSESERVLVACHYHQQVRGESDVGARAISDELKQMGHGSSHVSWTMRQLNAREPALLMVASKSGSGRGTKYRYRLTSAGSKRVSQMLDSRAESRSVAKH